MSARRRTHHLHTAPAPHLANGCAGLHLQRERNRQAASFAGQCASWIDVRNWRRSCPARKRRNHAARIDAACCVLRAALHPSVCRPAAATIGTVRYDTVPVLVLVLVLVPAKRRAPLLLLLLPFTSCSQVADSPAHWHAMRCFPRRPRWAAWHIISV